MIENIERFFEPGFSVWRGGNTPDAWGGNVFTYAVHIAALSGRLRPLTGDMRMSADKDTHFGTHRFYCFPADIKGYGHSGAGCLTGLDPQNPSFDHAEELDATPQASLSTGQCQQ